MSKLKEFIDEWFPKIGWEHVKTFILDSGVELVEQENQKWLPGYTNISKCSKPHHKDKDLRYKEESMFMLHDTLHQLFTINVFCDEEEYVKRQIIGEFFVFYLTEYAIPFERFLNEGDKSRGRDCFGLILEIEDIFKTYRFYRYYDTLFDFMWDCFIEGKHKSKIQKCYLDIFEKYSRMFQQDLENSRKNYKFVKDLNIKQNYCIVGKTSRNHIDFFESVKSGAIKNIKREFNLKLPKEWV